MGVRNYSKYLWWKIIAVFVIAALWVSSVQADLKLDINRALLREAAPDTSRTDHEKLFVYRCETIEKTIGFSETPTGRATKFSCEEPAVGIAFYAGADLGKHPPEKVGKYFQDELAKHGMNSEVFIKHDHDYGSSMGFYINGDSWLRDPVRPSKGVEMIEALAAEAKLILLTKGRITEWPKAPISQ